MSNKLSTTRKKMSSLGIRKTKGSDYEYIDQGKENQIEYNSVSCKSDLINTVEGKYKILVCEKNSSKH